MDDSLHLDPRIIHAGEPDEPIGGAAIVPVFQSTVFAFEGAESRPDP